MNTPETKPTTFNPCLIEGVLESESNCAVHEGFWDGKKWKSIRYEDGLMLNIEQVTAWEYMPDTLKPTITETIQSVRQWGIDKGITGPEGKGTLYSQAEKMTEEANETMEAVASYNRASLNCDQWEMDHAKPEIIDGIGDTAVTLILLAEILGVPFEQCLQVAYVVISKRTGKMIDGTFVKNVSDQ